MPKLMVTGYLCINLLTCLKIEKPEHNGSHEEEKTVHLHWLDQCQ